MPYYRRRKRLKRERWGVPLFVAAMIAVGIAAVLFFLSWGLLNIGLLLVKVFPWVTVFQATIIPLVLLVFIGILIAIGVFASNLNSNLIDFASGSEASADEPPESKDWPYRTQGPTKLDY